MYQKVVLTDNSEHYLFSDQLDSKTNRLTLNLYGEKLAIVDEVFSNKDLIKVIKIVSINDLNAENVEAVLNNYSKNISITRTTSHVYPTGIHPDFTENEEAGMVELDIITIVLELVDDVDVQLTDLNTRVDNLTETVASLMLLVGGES